MLDRKIDPVTRHVDSFVAIRSGESGELRATIPLTLAGAWVGETLALGDATGDGVPDFAYTAFEGEPTKPFRGHLFLHSGADLTCIRHLDLATGGILGRYSAALGDVDGDGLPDLALGCTPALADQPGGRVLVISGKSGETLLDCFGTDRRFQFGCGVASAGDWNGDGRCDVLVASSLSGSTVPFGNRVSLALVEVRSGKDGAVLQTFSRDERISARGHWVDTMKPPMLSACQDLDGDGTLDLAIVSLARDNAGEVYFGDRSKKPSRFLPFGGSVNESWSFGTGLQVVDDLDGDGVRDLASGDKFSPTSSSSRCRVLIHSGVTGEILFDWEVPCGSSLNCPFLGWLGDLDHDGSPELLIDSEYGYWIVSLRKRV